MELLATDVEYKSRGCASAMLQYGVDEADRENIECYVDSSPQAWRLYEKFGWIQNGRRPLPTVDGFEYVERFMIRPARGNVGGEI